MIHHERASGRVLEGLEGRLTTTQLVVRWLDASHAFGTFEAYLEWMLELDPSQQPEVRLVEDAATAARRAAQGTTNAKIEHEVREARRDARFLIRLAVAVNVAAAEAILENTLRIRALSAEGLVLACQPMIDARMRSVPQDDLVGEVGVWSDDVRELDVISTDVVDNVQG